MRHSINMALAFAFLAGCSSSSSQSTPDGGPGGTTDSGGTAPDGGATADSGTTADGTAPNDTGTTADSTTPGDTGTTGDTGIMGSDTGVTTGGTCGSATLFAGNPTFANPAQRPSDGDNILTGTPYLYQLFHFMSGGQILTNDQLSVWRIDTATSKLHAVAGGPLTGNPQLLAGAAPGVACGTARFADLLGSAVDSQGNLFVSDYANAILKVTSPLDASTCTVSYFAGTATEIDGPMLDQSDGNSGTADGTGSAAQFLGPEGLTIDASDNLYLLDHATAWSIRKLTPAAVVTTIATFSDNQYAFGELQYFGGKVWFWARGNDASDLDTANLIAIDPSVTSPVANPPSLLTLHGADLGGNSSASFQTGGITTDGTKLYVEAIGRIYTVTLSGGTPTLGSPVAGENDSTWTDQGASDFAAGYDATATQTAASVELLDRDNTSSWGVCSYLSRDPSGDLYFTAESDDVYVEKITGCP